MSISSSNASTPSNTNRGKPDSFHAAYAFHKKRFLLTKNAKHYLDDHALPFNRLHGVIAIKGDMRDVRAYAAAILWIREVIVPFGGEFIGEKISLSQHELTRRYIGTDGRIVTLRFKRKKGVLVEWISK